MNAPKKRAAMEGVPDNDRGPGWLGGLTMRKRLRLIWLVLAIVPVSPTTSSAITTTFTEAGSFLVAAPGTPGVLDFEGLASGTLIPSGTAQGGITFSYSIDGLTLQVVDSFDTTSPANSLGLTGGDDALLDGDEVDLVFSTPISALGMHFITSDAAVANEIQLVTPEGTALGSGVVETTLGDGGFVYFLGLVSTSTFSSATIAFANDGEVNFAFNVDDITTVPESGTLALLGLGILGWLALGDSRPRHQDRSVAARGRGGLALAAPLPLLPGRKTR